MEKENKLIGEVSQEQIDAWKSKYKEVSQIVTDGHVAYLKKPDRSVISYALSQMRFAMSPEDGENIEMDMGRMYKMGEAVMANCWIGGSEEVRTNDQLWVSACLAAGQLVEFKEGELKKL